MMRGLAQVLLAFALIASLLMTCWQLREIARNPLLRPFVDATANEIVAATDRAVAAKATPEQVAKLINGHLAADPRNWIALTALMDLAVKQGVTVPSEIQTAYDTAWENDNGTLVRTGKCLICAYDPATCSLSNVLICQAPVAFTPVGDVLGLAQGGVNWVAGTDVDEIDVALSGVGLTATALVLVSGGSSATIKAGASTMKLARRMNLLSPRLLGLVTDAVRNGNTGVLSNLAFDLDRLRTATSVTDTLHMLRYVDDASDARRLADVATALGPRTVAAAEMLGKARLLRATLRVSETAWRLMVGLAGLALSLALLIGGWLQSRMLHILLRRATG
jgi:hypothetical protein